MKTHTPPFRLKEIKLELTYRCPLGCVHCSSDAEASSPLIMSFTDATRILREALEMGVRTIAFSGGEPLIWSGLTDLVALCANVGASVSVYTSGNVPDMDRLAQDLKAAGVGKFAFSLYAGNAVLHEQVTRRAGSFKSTLAAAAIVRRFAIPFEFHFVPMSVNFKELPSVVALANQSGATQVSVLRFVPQGRGAIMSSLALNRAQNIHLRRLVIQAKQAFTVRTGSPYNFFCLNDQPECCAGIDRLVIGPDLSIHPCDAFKHLRPGDSTGDPFSVITDSLSDCWNRSSLLQAVREHLTTGFQPPCYECSALDKCLSGCLAQKVIAHGDFQKRPDPMCLKERVAC